MRPLRLGENAGHFHRDSQHDGAGARCGHPPFFDRNLASLITGPYARTMELRVLTSVFTVALASAHIEAAPASAPGARVPFVTYEAEAPANHTTGRIVRMTGLPSSTASSPEMEASSRAFVELAKPNDSLDIRVTNPANTLVLRHCIPDAPGGGGITATLSLLVNGQFRQSLELSSKHNWLYGPEGQNGQSNDPSAGQPHVFWEEQRYIIAGVPLRNGDTIRLQKGLKDTAAFYRIDLVDLELAAAVPPPAAGSFLSVADFGANGQDDKDDTDAIQKCIDAAKQQNKTVWIPRGTYYQSKRFNVDGVTVRGEGMWLTNIIGNTQSTTFAGELGFELKGDGAKISDLFMDSAVNTSRSNSGTSISGGQATGWLIENVWVTHTGTGFWLGGKKGVVRGCRVRFTYADGINLNSGASENLVENNHIRGTGDDSLAILSEAERNWPVSTGNTLRHNTAIATWWGHNCDLAGGTGHVVEDNYLADNPKFGCFTINLPTAYPMHALADSIVRRNTIVRGGGNFANQHRGAVWISAGSTTISGVKFEENVIHDSVFRGIQFTGSSRQEMTIERNLIERTGEDGITVDAEAKGTGIFKNNIVRNFGRGYSAFVNKAAASYKAEFSGNSFH
jgi:hypothetical protein